MNYFENINELDAAKKRHRQLVRKLHPDIGGSKIKFQDMQGQYKILLEKLNGNINSQIVEETNNELMSELSKLAKVMLDKKIPQQILQSQIKIRKSPLQKALLNGLVSILNDI